jgi:Zn-dependent protease
MITDDSIQTPSQPVSATRYFRLDSRKVSFREYWNIVRSWKVIIPWVAKLLNLPMNFSSGMPSVLVQELKVAESDFAADAREKLQPLWDQCQRMGFHSPQFHSYVTMRGDSRICFIALLHPSGATLRLMHTMSTKVHPPIVKVVAVLLSELSDGTFFFTSDQREMFLTAPGIQANRLPGATPAQLMKSHLEKIEAFKMRNPAREVGSVDALDNLWDRYERLCREFGMKRGIYVWMSPEEVGTEQKQIAETKTMAGPTAENMEVITELNKLQNKKAGWGSAIIILIVSLGLFVGTGSRQWSWDVVLILVPVLFVHELGHYIAMRAFNYRNLRMFFIPFFGAAVSGQHYNVAGWKKVVVSLMGPVPGIILGAIIGGAGLVLHNALMMKVAVMTLILNGFNLLPVLPFDGGWVFHTLLFSRHHMLDTAFRVLAAVALLAGGMFSHNKILMYLSIPMFIGIPAAYRTARIATTLRKRGIGPASVDDQTIPTDTAQAIIGELKLKPSNAKLQSNKMLAQQALQIFETLNARPPGWGATIGLLFAHLGSLGMAAVFAAVFVVAQRGGIGGLLAHGGRLPKHTYVCGDSSVWKGGQVSTDLASSQNTIVATFPSSRESKKVFQDLTTRLPAVASLKMFGESLFLVLPDNLVAARKEWLSELEKKTKEVFVNNTNFMAGASLSCLAPDLQTAETIENELNGYFGTLSGESLVPPWIPQDSRSAEERHQHQVARQTYLALQKTQYEGYENAEVKKLEKQIAAAVRQGDQAEANALRASLRELTLKLRVANMERVRDGKGGSIDAKVADLLIAITADEGKTNAAHSGLVTDMAQRMGQLPRENGIVPPTANRFSAQMGMVSHDKLRIHLVYVSFEQVADGAPALVQWLCDKGCSDFKYGFSAGAGLNDFDGE